MRRAVCVHLLLLQAAYGCGSRHVPGAATPTEAATVFHRLAAAARWSEAADYLADDDVALWADGHRVGQYPELELEPEGAPGVLPDSARLRSRRGDTALVEMFVSGPDWSDQRWHRAMDSLLENGADRSRMIETVLRRRRTLPLERMTRTVPVVLQDGRWRVSLGLRIRERFRRHREGMDRWSAASRQNGSLRATRLRAASTYLALAESYPALADTAVYRDAAEMLRLAPYADSVDVGVLNVLPGSAGWSIVRGTVRNRSATHLKQMTIHVMDGSGFTDEVVVHEVPARSTVAIDLSTRLEPGRSRAAVVAWVETEP
jgi:hypothetical protein